MGNRIRTIRAAGAAAALGVASCQDNAARTADHVQVPPPRPARLELVAPTPTGIRRADSLELRASTSVTDSVLTLRVTLVNHSRRTRHLSWASCSMSLQLYREPSLAGRPVYDWNNRPNPDPEYGRMACATYRVDKDLAPADSIAPQEYAQSIPVRRLAGDSLVAGRYFIAADVRLSADGPGRAEHIIVPAGTANVIR